MGFRGVRREKVEAERVDDEEDGAFVGGFQCAWRRWVGARGDGRKGEPAKQETTGEKINSDEMEKGEVEENPRGSKHDEHGGNNSVCAVRSWLFTPFYSAMSRLG